MKDERQLDAVEGGELTPKPLTGIRVLDCSKVLAGPLCAQYMADMGAEVIKVEHAVTGDETRAWPPFRAPGLGAVFMSANRGKRSVGIDLKTAEGREIVHGLAKTSDVVIESFGTGVAERLGIDAGTLRALNPQLVHCSISGFGREGPMRNAPGYDVILQAFSGVMAMTGEDGGAYVRSPISPIDQTTGIHALTGILAALLRRGVTNTGGTVEVSLFETALGLLGYNLQSFWEKGIEPARCGSSHESLCPYQAFEAADGAVMIGVANDSLWARFCTVAGLEAFSNDPRFATNPARVQHRAETVALVAEAIARQPVAFWDRELAAVKVPCSPIASLSQMLAHPHTEAINLILDFDLGGQGTARAVHHPVRFDGTRREAGLPPPQLGEHTDAILQEAGFCPERLEQLRTAGVIR